MHDATVYLRERATEGIPPSLGALWCPAAFWQAQVPLRFDMATADVPPEQVYGNHGRWVVRCPDCNGAQLACRTDRRFLCNECGNVVVGGLFRPIVWPGNAAAIEALLDQRPLAQTRNWEPWESVTDLIAENAAHGIGP